MGSLSRLLGGCTTAVEAWSICIGSRLGAVLLPVGDPFAKPVGAAWYRWEVWCGGLPKDTDTKDLTKRLVLYSVSG